MRNVAQRLPLPDCSWLQGTLHSYHSSRPDVPANAGPNDGDNAALRQISGFISYNAHKAPVVL
jgi:hypothetical protein